MSTFGAKVGEKARVLLVGLDPAKIDFSKTPFPDLTAEKVMEGLNKDVTSLNTKGYTAELFLIDGTQEVTKLSDNLKAHLTGNTDYGCVMIGNGVRSVPSNFLLFEALCNTVHANAPKAKMAFNTSPHDSLEAIERWC
eukprot:gene25391-31004_t